MALYDTLASETAAIDGVPYAEPFYYALADTTVYDVCYPLVIDGENLGAISIGYSMDSVESAIQKNVVAIAISGILAFLILGVVLYSSANNVIQVINKLKEQMGWMASGDFSHDVPEKLLSKQDELGEISGAIATMQSSMWDVIGSVIGAADQARETEQGIS